jgi:hypothetical protein
VRETHTNILSYVVPLLSGLREFEGPIGTLVRDICDFSRLYDYCSTVETIRKLILKASAFSKASLSSKKLDGVLPQIKVTVLEMTNNMH